MIESVSAIMQNDLVMAALPLFFIAVIIEALVSRKRALGWYDATDFRRSMLIMVTAALIDIVPKFVGIYLMFVVYEASPLSGVIGTGVVAWVILFFLDDFTYYWFHRFNHEIRLMWAGHVNHHSSQHMNLGTALRQGVGERVLKYFFWLPLAFLGFHPAMIVTMLSISLIYQFWIHTPAVNKCHPLIELLFNTPSHHRVHHASNKRYLDKNHGATLIIWDRLFGSFAQEIDEDPVVYGITKPLPDQRASTVLWHEYRAILADVRSAIGLRERIRQLFVRTGATG